jgi:hypothetical protein
LISIQKNKQWLAFEKIYGSQDLIKRYYWFLFEFGKRTTKLYHKHLGEMITNTVGDRDYKKKLVLAEVRDRGRFAWWAIVASAKPITGMELDPHKTLFKVVPRFEIAGDPVREILTKYGPWTVDTIPFIPSKRSGAVVAIDSDDHGVESTQARVKEDWKKINAKMVLFGIEFENRTNVYRKLSVLREIEVDAIRYEFISGKPHWRPSIRWLRKQGLSRMQKERDLIRVWIDPKFTKYRIFRHYRLKLSQDELKRIQDFQSKIRV